MNALSVANIWSLTSEFEITVHNNLVFYEVHLDEEFFL